MVTIFLCDDNRYAIDQYSALIRHTAAKNNIAISLSIFYSGESMLFDMYESPDLPDIIYLDVLMDKLNGIDTAKQLRKIGSNAEIIFLTTSEDYVFDSFDVEPVHYLLKHDTTEDKFEQVFLRAVQLSSRKEAPKFICKAGALRKVIPISEISHFSIWKGVVTVHHGKNEKFEYWSTMEKLQNELHGREFVRTHRSYLVHLPYIAMFKHQNLLLITGETVPIGITFVNSVRSAFSEYISRSNITRTGSAE